MSLPKFLQPYLASYDLSRLDIVGDKDVIITEILNKGDDKALLWLSKTYSKKEIKKVVFSPTRGLWMRSVLGYWAKILDVNLSREKFEQAVLDLNP